MPRGLLTLCPGLNTYIYTHIHIEEPELVLKDTLDLGEHFSAGVGALMRLQPDLLPRFGPAVCISCYVCMCVCVYV